MREGFELLFINWEELEAVLSYILLHDVMQGANICPNQRLMQIQQAL